jgi:alkaline phosphatase
MKIFVIPAALLSWLFTLQAEPAAKNVILFVGDAGGLSTLHAASVHAYGDAGKLFVQRMPHIALSETSSASDWVTDSAAGMTALVTGQKTHNGVLSESAATLRGQQDGPALTTILEYAEQRGLSTGVVTNDAVTGATPAACYAHANDRQQTGQILRQAFKPRFGDGVDVMIGANRNLTLAAAASSGLDLKAELERRGYAFTREINAVPKHARRVMALLDDEEFDLDQAATAAIDILSKNPKGFFLMVECDLHTDKLARGLQRAAKFDRIIQRVTERMRGDTLILFTADHSFDLRISGRAKKGEPLLTVGANGESIPAKGLTVYGHHSAEHVLVTADGPGSSKVHGFLANTDIFGIMMSAFGWNKNQVAD